MANIRDSLARIQAYVAGLSRHRLAVALGLVGVAVGGLVWLSAVSVSPSWAPAMGPVEDGEALSQAAETLRGGGLDVRVEAGRVLVRRADLARARAILAADVPPEGETAAQPFEHLARETDIWSSQSQQVRKWQAAKMLALGRLIGGLPGIRSATVLFEPGAPARFGRQAVEPTAAVQVTLEADGPMTPPLVSAIADQVSGSVPGLRPESVRIIDSAGRSYRADGQPGRGDALARLREAEAHFAARVRGLLGGAEGLTVGIDAAIDDGVPCCRGAALSVPRSYLLASYRAAQGIPALRGEVPTEHLREELERIQRSAAAALGVADPQAVQVSWHPDPAPPGAASVRTLAQPGWLARHGAAVTLAGIAAGFAVLTLVLQRRARRDEARSARAIAACEGGHESPADPPAAEVPADPFTMLAEAPPASLAAALAEEHPQTAAIAMARLPSGVSARVLSALPLPVRNQAARRMEALENADGEVAREIVAALAARIRNAPTDAGATAAPRPTDLRRKANVSAEQPATSGQQTSTDDLESVPAAWVAAAVMRLEMGEAALALRAAGEDVQKRVLRVLPARRRRCIRAVLSRPRPVRVRDVEAAQRRLLDAARECRRGTYASAAKTQLAG